MAAKMKVINAGTVMARIQQSMLLGLAVVSAYAGIQLAGYAGQEISYTQKTYTIEQAIKSGDFQTAQNLINGYNGAGLLRTWDSSQLGLMLEREKGVRQLDKEIENSGYEQARGALAALRNSGIYPETQLGELEKKVYGISEQGLFERVITADKSQKSELARRYLQIHPKGEHRTAVVYDLVSNEIEAFIASIEAYSEFGSLYSQMAKLTELLETYSTEKIKLPQTTLPSLSRNRIEDKIFSRFWESNLEGFKTGNVARVRKSIDNINTNTTFIKERDGNFPIGSIGEIVDKGTRRVYLRFDGDKIPQWGKKWDQLDKYWKGANTNVADYYPGELLQGQRIDDFEKDKFWKGMQNLYEVIIRSY